MQRVNALISKLLVKHDCVIIPNFGGFVAQYKSAELDEATGSFTPPSKHILFNVNLKNNDGLLANELAQQENISFIKANELISSFVQEIKNNLKSKSAFKFNELGTIVNNKDSISFKQNSINFLESSFGLSAINLREFNHTHERDIKTQDHVKINNKSNKYKWLAAASLLPIIFLLSWLFLSNDFFNYSPNFKFSDFNPFSISAKLLDSTSSKIEAKEIVNSNKKSINKEPELKNDVTNKPEFEEYNVQKKYHVIVGCFGNKKNASRLTKKLIKKGYNAFELDVHNNLHRIAIGSFRLKDDAIITLKKIKSKEKMSSWILTK